MMKFGANVTQTALIGLNLAQAGNYDHVLNLKYTCRALPSCLIYSNREPNSNLKFQSFKLNSKWPRYYVMCNFLSLKINKRLELCHRLLLPSSFVSWLSSFLHLLISEFTFFHDELDNNSSTTIETLIFSQVYANVSRPQVGHVP